MNWRKLFRGMVLMAGLGIGTVAFLSALRASRESTAPSIVFMIAAFVLVIVSLQSGSRGWTTLFDGHGDRLKLASGLFTSQLAKYLPGGGALQIAGQVSMSRDGTISLARASMAYPMYALVTVAASSFVAGSLVISGSDIPATLRVAAALGLVSPIFLVRGAALRVMNLARKLIHRIPPNDLIPSQQSILRSFAFGVPMMLATALAFALLLRSLDGSTSVAVATGAFAAAWVAGFLVVPLPAGAGVREGVLVIALGGAAPLSAIIAASLAHRVVTILGEIVMILVYRQRVRHRSPGRAGNVDDEIRNVN